LEDSDNFDFEAEPEAVSATVTDEKPSKKLGRPRGAKNKFSADARALLELHGPAVVRQLCRIASGKTVYRWPAGGGAKEELTPSVKDMIHAGELIIDRMMPALKSTELTGANQSPLIPESNVAVGLTATAEALQSIFREAALRSSPAPLSVLDPKQLATQRTEPDEDSLHREDAASPSVASADAPTGLSEVEQRELSALGISHTSALDDIRAHDAAHSANGATAAVLSESSPPGAEEVIDGSVIKVEILAGSNQRRYAVYRNGVYEAGPTALKRQLQHARDLIASWATR
jgi:hypothetical protein